MRHLRRFMRNKIIYFTTAQDLNSFANQLHNWSISPNLSNQNFHNKLIRSISLSHQVDVVSVRPINKNYSLKKLEQNIVKEENINWNYVKVSRSRIDKALHYRKYVNNSIPQDVANAVVMVDVLNTRLLKEAIFFAKKNKLPIVGICTDSPYNISYTKESYAKKNVKLANQLDGYVVLTKPINNLYNTHVKPFIVIDGVSEENKSANSSPIEGKYIYFGGSLMTKYGIYNLIDAYKELDLKDIKLVICGHHVNKEQLDSAIRDNENIIYLGALDYQKNLDLEKHAYLAVNPRPKMPEVDEYSFPSKTLEFLANGILNIAVNNEYLKENYGDSIIFANSGKPCCLKKAIIDALSLSDEERNKRIEIGKKIAMQRTSLESINKQIDELVFKLFLN